MANIISNDQVKEGDYLQMSNGLTSVFIDTICLAGSDIAQQVYQKDLMIWFAQRDPQLMGSGLIGFDIADIIWKKEIFPAQKAFLLTVLESAAEKKHWDKLGYSPREDWAIQSLQEFKRMLTEFEVTHIDEEEQESIIPFDKKYVTCPKHHIFLHVQGCVICNNS